MSLMLKQTLLTLEWEKLQSFKNEEKRESDIIVRFCTVQNVLFSNGLVE